MNISYYEKESHEIIDNMECVKEFFEDFDNQYNETAHYRFSTNVLFKLCHPITIIKNNIKYKKLTKIKNEYDNIYNTTVMKFVTEETGNLDEDLEYAAKVVKPKHVEEYVKTKKLKK